jgi:hypothetical protein
MTAAIYFTPDFPHATLQGYEQGCTGQICEGRERFGWSCADTQRKYVGDYQWRKWLLADMTPVQIMAELEAEKVAARERVAAERVRVKASKPARARAHSHTGPRDEPHGTAQRYRQGCYTDCPNTEYTCSQASAQYAKDRRRARGLKPRVYVTQPIVHGTASGAKKGCVSIEDCPAEISCVEARRKQQSEWRKSTKEARAT